jgi:hypothetical protein
MMSVLNFIFLVSLISGSVLSFDATYDITAWKPSDVSTPQLFTFCTKTKADDYAVALEGLAFKLTLAGTAGNDDIKCYQVSSCDIWRQIHGMESDDKAKVLNKEFTKIKVTSKEAEVDAPTFRMNGISVNIKKANETVHTPKSSAATIAYFNGYHGCNAEATVKNVFPVTVVAVSEEHRLFPYCVSDKELSDLKAANMKTPKGNKVSDRGEIMIRTIKSTDAAELLKENTPVDENFKCSGATSVFVASFAIFASILSITGILKQ